MEHHHFYYLNWWNLIILVYFLYLGFSTAIVFLSFGVIYFAFNYWKTTTSDEWLNEIPGPVPKFPLIGNLDIFRIKGVPLNMSIYRILTALAQVYNKYGIFKIFLGSTPVVLIFRQNTIGTFLASNVNIEKSEGYGYIEEWLGKGLLTSAGQLWKNRRRMLTPAFHFRILEDFIPIMNEQSDILVANLRKAIEQPFIDMREPILQCTLDVICETAMGVSIGAQVGKNKNYLKAVHDTGEAIMKRAVSPLLWSNFVFYKTPIGRQFKKDLDILHSMTRDVILQRKADIISKKIEVKTELTEDFIEYNAYDSNKSRKRMAFLDLLLEYHIDSNSLSLEDIREEVDTFMFEGHDTTAVSLAWTLYLLGLHPEVQIRIQEELQNIFGSDKGRDITAEDLKQMDYLECVIKESLRLFPSVPLIGRTLTEDMKCDKYVLKKGTPVYLLIERLHQDPEVFPQPLLFKPERFEMNNTSNINAFTYVPFSAGARSCIGKRFALNEEKIILSKIFLNFNLHSLDPRDLIISSAEMIYRPKIALRVKVIPVDFERA